MLEEAYYFGLTPKEATELTFSEMASFVQANRRRQIDEWRMLAEVGYSGGIVASMALQKDRPRFKDLFNFPDQRKSVSDTVKDSEVMLTAWAEQVNREFRKESKRG